MYEEQREDEIDLLELARVLLAKWFLILVIGVIGGALAFLGTKTFITPQYEASSMIYMLSKSNAITSALDIQLGNQITGDFMILAKSRPVVEKVIEEQNAGLTYEAMCKKITVTNPSNTQILKVSVQDEDPQVACDLANAMAEAVSERVADVMNTDEPNMVEDAVVPEDPVSPNTLKNTAIAAVGCMFVVMAILVVQYLMDDRIKTEDDVLKYLELNTIGSIPMVNMDKEAKKAKKKRK